MKYIFLFVLSLFILNKLSAQTGKTEAHVVGHVLDKITGKHIPFVNIVLKGTTIGTTTDVTGHFFIKNLPVGEHTLVFSAVGYKRYEHHLEIKANTIIEVNVELEPDVMMLEQVVVSAAREQKERKEVGIPVQVILPRQMEMQGATNLAEALSNVTGLRVEGTCQNCGFLQVRVNGLEGQYTQLLIDGYPIMSSMANVYALEQIPFTMIERIEILRGGSSALYGSNAIAGVINIITREPAGRHTYVAHQSKLIGNKSFAHSTNLYTTMVSDDTRLATSVFAASQRREPFDANSDGFSEIPFLKMVNVGLKSLYRPSIRSKVQFEYHVIDDFRRGGNKFKLPPHQTDITELAESSIHSGHLSYQALSVNQKHTLKAFSAGQYVNRCSYYGAQQDPNAYGYTDDWTAMAGIQHQMQLSQSGNVTLTYLHGVDFQYNSLRDEFPSYGRFLKQDVHNIAYFAQSDITSGKFSLLLGGRADRHNLIDKIVFSPRASLRYQMTNNFSLRGGVSTGFRAPQTFTEDLHITLVSGTGVVIMNDPDLRPEFSRSLFASAEHLFQGKLFSGLFRLEGFYTLLKEIFVLEEIGNDQNNNMILLRKNALGATVRGIHTEFMLIFLKTINVSAGLTIQQGKYDTPIQWSDDPHSTPQQIFFRSPERYGYISLEFEPLPSWQLFISNTYTGPMYVPHYAGYIEKDRIERTTSFHDVTIQLHKIIMTASGVQIQATAGVQNILNSYQKDFDLGQERDSGYIYGPTYPRTFQMGLRLLL